MAKSNATGINISKNTETVIGIEAKNLDILINAFTQWKNAKPEDRRPSVSFADEDGVKTVTFAYFEGDEDEDA